MHTFKHYIFYLNDLNVFDNLIPKSIPKFLIYFKP